MFEYYSLGIGIDIFVVCDDYNYSLVEYQKQ